MNDAWRQNKAEALIKLTCKYRLVMVRQAISCVVIYTVCKTSAAVIKRRVKSYTKGENVAPVF
jgi:hypothetical protein